MAKEEKVKEEKTLADFKVEELLAEVHGRGYLATKMQATSGKTFSVASELARFSGKSIRFGVVSDTHLCSRYQQLHHLNAFYSLCARRRIKLVLHCGDVFAGFKVYRGQEFEVFMHGYASQLKYGIDRYPKRRGIKTKMIAGNHDSSFIKTAGAFIVKELGRRRVDIDYLGEDLAFLKIGGISISLMHGAGGGAYATSYKSQKIVEKMPGGKKPHFLFLGHFHNPNHIPMYRNVEVVQMSCFEAQTPFLARRALNPIVAGLIVTVTPDEKGIGKVIYEWVPFYEHIADDY